jgi:uncharacterized protein YbaA (DUF1428 family)
MKKTGNYVDGFVLPVPRKNLDAYKKMARMPRKVWLDHGALDYVESMADDVPEGKSTSFSKSVKLKKGEVVFFSWATYKNRKHRDQVMKKVMTDPRMTDYDPKAMPFDGKRMFWGGFKTVIKA